MTAPYCEWIRQQWQGNTHANKVAQRYLPTYLKNFLKFFPLIRIHIFLERSLKENVITFFPCERWERTILHTSSVSFFPLTRFYLPSSLLLAHALIDYKIIHYSLSFTLTLALSLPIIPFLLVMYGSLTYHHIMAYSHNCKVYGDTKFKTLMISIQFSSKWLILLVCF